MDRIPVLEDEANRLAGEFKAAQTRALSGSAAPASGGTYAGKHFPRSSLEAMRPSFGGKSAAEIERIIKAEGGTIN
jgi:hypothetical protein